MVSTQIEDVEAEDGVVEEERLGAALMANQTAQFSTVSFTFSTAMKNIYG